MKYVDIAVRMLVACVMLLMTVAAMVDKEYVPALLAATAVGVSVPPYRGRINAIRWVLVLCLAVAHLLLLPTPV